MTLQELLGEKQIEMRWQITVEVTDGDLSLQPSWEAVEGMVAVKCENAKLALLEKLAKEFERRR